MSETLPRLLLRLSEAGDGAYLTGRDAKPFFGKEFERLLALRVLVEKAPLAEWSACSGCECELGMRPIQSVSGQPVAVCQLDASQDLLLEQQDLKVFEIDATQLVAEISPLQRSPQQPAFELLPGVWHLSSRVGKPVILVLSGRAVRDPSLLSMLRFRAAECDFVLLPTSSTPDLHHRLADAGFRVASLIDVLQADWSLNLGRVVHHTRVQPRLVIRVGDRQVILDECEVFLPDQPFRLLVILANAAQTAVRQVDGRAIERQLWNGLQQPASRELRDIVRELRDGMSARAENAQEVRRLVHNKRSPVSSYGLLLRPEEIVFGD